MTEQVPEWGEEKEKVVVVVGVVVLLKDQAETASAQSVAKEYLIKREQAAQKSCIAKTEVPSVLLHFSLCR